MTFKFIAVFKLTAVILQSSHRVSLKGIALEVIYLVNVSQMS